MTQSPKRPSAHALLSAGIGQEARPLVSPLGLNLAVAFYLLAVLNGGFWAQANSVFKGAPLDLMGFGGAVLALTLLSLSLVSLPFLHRPALVALILTAAGAEHFRRSYGVLIDREMIQNAMLTTAAESRHLFTPALMRDMVLTGLLPAALVFVPRLRPVRLRHLLWRYPLAIAASAALMSALLMTDFKTYASAVREHREMMAAYQPGATVAAAVRYGKQRFVSSAIVTAPFGRDARPGPMLAAAQKPVLLVLFVGETARAQNFGLNGYARDTTPELAALAAGGDVVNFADTWSCGTSTAVSLPCMFSALGQDGYSQSRALAQENLVDVLSHAGLAVEWIDNNTGDQGIAVRTGSARITPADDPVACAAGECTDAAFLPLLRDRLAHIARDTVLVLHMIGSHGPAYYLRYPPEAAHFTPDCRSASFADCTNAEIVNAYDNSIRYTDHILGQAIAMMQAQDRVIPALMYMSDHGESLGENGLYLHAAPMFMAPETQRKVPFVVWLPDVFAAAMGVGRDCLAAEAGKPQSHDVLFHSVLGLMDVTTSVRDPALDLTAGCRKGA